MIAALSFLTPIGGARTPTAAAVPWFPVVGLLVGLGVGGVWWGAGELWPPLVAAALAVAADLVLTGMLHLDGVADSADGLLPHLDRPRRLEVMADPTVGAFGVSVVAGVLLLRWSALASMAPDPWLVAGLWSLSRTLMAAVTMTVPYARPGGLAQAFAGASRITILLGWLLAAVVLALAVEEPAIVVLPAAWAGGGAVVLLARARIGGYTGDVLGAAGVVTETVGLLVASARW